MSPDELAAIARLRAVEALVAENRGLATLRAENIRLRAALQTLIDATHAFEVLPRGRVSEIGDARKVAIAALAAAVDEETA